MKSLNKMLREAADAVAAFYLSAPEFCWVVFIAIAVVLLVTV